MDVRSSSAKRVRRESDTASPAAEESKAERRQRLEAAQQDAIALQQQQLLDATPDEPTPPVVQPAPLRIEAEEPTGQENAPPPSAKAKAGKAGKAKAKAVRKGKKGAEDGAEESESAAAVSDAESSALASEREEGGEVETGKRKRTRANKALDEHVDSATTETKKATRARATKKAADDKPTEAEEGRTTRTRAAAKRAEAEKDKVKDREVTEVPETKKAKKAAVCKKKAHVEESPPVEDDSSVTAVASIEQQEEVVMVQHVESVVEVVEVLHKQDTEMAVGGWVEEEQQRSSANTSVVSSTAAIESLLEDEVSEDEPLSTLLAAKKLAQYPSLSAITPPSVPSTPLSSSPVPSPSSAASRQQFASDDKPAEPVKPASLVSWLKAPFSLLGIGGGSVAMKKETMSLASVTPGAMLAPALKSSPSTTPATSPVPSPAASPASSPVLQPLSAPITAMLPPLASSASLPPPLPVSAPTANVEAANAAKSRKEELKAKLEASKQQMKDKIEEARALGSSGSNQGGSNNTTPTSTPTPSSASLGAERKDSVDAAISRQTAEHIQVIDIVDLSDERATTGRVTESAVGAADVQLASQRDEGSHFVVAEEAGVVSAEAHTSESTTAAMDITLLSSAVDVTMVEPDESANDDMADATMASDESEVKRDERTEGSVTYKAKSSKAETAKRKEKDMKEKQLEAARKREEVEKRRRQLEEAERRKQEEKEEERRKKEEQLKKTKQQQATDKKKAAATLKPQPSTSTSIKSSAATTKHKKVDDKKEIARTLPLPSNGGAGGVGGAASRSATLPEPLSIVELGSSVSYSVVGREEKEREEKHEEDGLDGEMKYAEEEEEKEAVVLSSYAPVQSQPTQHTNGPVMALTMNPPPLPPLPTAVKAMPPPPPLPAKPTTSSSNNPPFVPLVKFHMPQHSGTTHGAEYSAVLNTPSILPPPKPYEMTLKSGPQPAAVDSSMSPPSARLPYTKTPPHAQNGTGLMMPPPMPVMHTPEHGKLLPPSAAATLHPSTATSSSTSTPQQAKAKPSPQSYIFTPPARPLLSPDSNNYRMSDHEHSDASDEDESSAQKRRDARIPSWAKEPHLSTALRAQQMAAVDPDSIFPPIDPFSMSLKDIFKGYKKRRPFRERTSSGNWQMDQLSVREEMQYKRDMGYVRQGVEAVAATQTVSHTVVAS